jgi:oligopeptide/dipeptide ABC transporter ATP-binding protein
MTWVRSSSSGGGPSGESGCDKTTAARLVLRLIEATAGEIRFDGADITKLGRAALRKLRRQMQLVFQDPLSSLNPRMSVGGTIAESLRFHGIGSREERQVRAREMLDVVGLSRRYFNALPHEFSGGQCQRVGIARALVLRPKLVVLDEPVSALDVSVRSQILNLLLDLRREFGLTYVMISHDLAVVKRVCDRTAVLYLGRVVELAESEALYREPLHPYSRALINAIPTPDPKAKRARDLGGIEGDVPSPIDPPKGCRFHTRCPYRMPICEREDPQLTEVAPGRSVACFLHHPPAAAAA